MRPAILLAMLLFLTPLWAQPKAETNFPPDATTLATIQAKITELTTAVAELKSAKDDVRADVEIHLKAAVWLVKLNQFPSKDTAKQTVTVLDAGMVRAKAAKQGKTPWRDVRGRPIICGYFSSVDGSVQPYAVTIPEEPIWKRIDVVLHGRDDTLTEVKFIAGHDAAKPKPDETDGAVIVEPYGRGNLAYRWAGETDANAALHHLLTRPETGLPLYRVLRGFSMGGAGAWHIGLHYPHHYDVIGPGAGFTTTRGYVKNLPEKLPDYVEKCLHIYDAVDYAENAFNVPVVAYSGANDPQKAAADNIENALANFKEPFSFKHLIAPGLMHKQPPEWLAKCETEYRKHFKGGFPKRTRFVTYTTAYPGPFPTDILGMEEHYRKAVLDATMTEEELIVATENITAFRTPAWKKRIIVNGTILTVDSKESSVAAKLDGRWRLVPMVEWNDPKLRRPRKTTYLSGPIDDAFRNAFQVLPSKSDGSPVAESVVESRRRFDREWQRHFRGELPEVETPADTRGSVVVFGTPVTNAIIREALPLLPIRWTAGELVVNGVTYDATTHYPALIYPHPKRAGTYLVLNSGHTFREADLKGSNANLYPRLGDWAVLKIAPTKDDPAATEVVAAGLFDEFWQFKK